MAIVRGDIPFYVSIGSNDFYPYISIPSPDIRTAIRRAVAYIRKRDINLHAIAFGLDIYLGWNRSHLKDAKICTLRFPEEFAKVEPWSTSPEMCGVDVTIKKDVTRPKFYKYATVLKHWKWDVDCSYEEYIGRYRKMLSKFKYSQFPTEKECRELGCAKIPMEVKLTNQFDKCVKTEEEVKFYGE